MPQKSKRRSTKLDLAVSHDELDHILLQNELEQDHLFFSRYFFKARQNIKFIVNWHHQLISDSVQKVMDGEIKNLIINVPPGSSKTEMVVINFIARGLAINPWCRFLHLSYSDDLALLNSQTARDMITGDEYQALWPLKISDDTKSKKRWNVDIDGNNAGGVYATSLAGQITGFRAGHMTTGFMGCFIGSTQIRMNRGLKSIDEIEPGDLVYSYNHDTQKTEYKSVRATKISLRNDIVEVETASGRSFRCTPCHRFFDGKSYRAISTFSKGDLISVLPISALDEMHGLSNGIPERKARSSQGHGPWVQIYILLKKMYKPSFKKDKKTYKASRNPLLYLRKNIQAGQSNVSNLFLRLCKSIALKKDERGRELKLSRWSRALQHLLQKNENINSKERWRLLFDLLFKEEIDCSPYRSSSRQQQPTEFSHSLSEMSCNPSQISYESISRITRLGELETKVYDIQVDGNHNFFANGVLAHNCILIDDPLKPEDAFSKSKIAAANRKLLTTVKSRKANPDTPIVLIMQRIAENDPTGFILSGNLPGEWTHISIPAVMTNENVQKLDPKYQSLIERDGTERFSYWPYKERIEELLIMEKGDGQDKDGAKIGRQVFASQYQQNPIAIGGNIIKSTDFVMYKEPPKIKWRKIFADTAQKTKERNDYSVFQEWGYGEDGKGYLLDLIRGKWEAPDLQKRAVAFWAKAKAREVSKFGQLRKLMVEDKSSGTGLIQSLKLYPHNVPIEGIERERDKLTRVSDALPYIESRQVCIPEDAPFTNDFVLECEAFTSDDSHAHDDQIDPMADAIEDLLSNANKLKAWENAGR